MFNYLNNFTAAKQLAKIESYHFCTIFKILISAEGKVIWRELKAGPTVTSFRVIREHFLSRTDIRIEVKLEEHLLFVFLMGSREPSRCTWWFKLKGRIFPFGFFVVCIKEKNNKWNFGQVIWVQISAKPVRQRSSLCVTILKQSVLWEHQRRIHYNEFSNFFFFFLIQGILKPVAHSNYVEIFKRNFRLIADKHWQKQVREHRSPGCINYVRA